MRNFNPTLTPLVTLCDIRLALAQGHPLGNSRFSEVLCEATGIRRTQARRGRPTKPLAGTGEVDGEQMEFGL
jgi:hypothetical protein